MELHLEDQPVSRYFFATQRTKDEETVMAFMRQFFNFIDGVRMRGSDSESDSELNSDQDSSDWSPYAPPRSTHSDENEVKMSLYCMWCVYCMIE